MHHLGPRRLHDMECQALHNFLGHLALRVQEDPSRTPLVVWDGRAEFRYAIHPGYKSDRHKTEEQRTQRAKYQRQVPLIQQFLHLLGVAQVLANQAEADDVACQLTRWLSPRGHSLHLYSSDTDWWQFLAENVVWQGVRKGEPLVTFEGFTDHTGYQTPQEYIEGKAMQGDTADSIDGVDRVGPVTAKEIMNRYRTPTNFYEQLDAGLVILKNKKALTNLTSQAGRDIWKRNLQLMDLAKAPRLTPEDLRFKLRSFDENKVKSLCKWWDIPFSRLLPLCNRSTRAAGLLDGYGAQLAVA